MGNLNSDIADRLTPSAPIELSFGAQPVSTGKKFTTLIGHKAAGATGLDYQVYQVINVGDPVAAQAEVDAIAGSGSQIGQMAAAFIKANSFANRSNFPAFRVVLLPMSELHFGPASDALAAILLLRSDMIVSCYPAGDTTNRTTLLNFCSMISGIDRDLSGQFGTFMSLGSLDALSVQVLYAINSRFALVHGLPDSNTALVTADGDTVVGSDQIQNMASVAGIYPGALVSGTGIPAGAVVEQIIDNATIQISAAATAAAVGESISFQNVVSQAPEIVSAACAGAMMSFGQPYIPLQGVTVGGIVPPQKASDRVVIDPNGSSEAMLQGGISPLVMQPGGTMGFVRTRTTFTTLPGPGNIAATAYFDWQDLVVMNDFKEEVFQITQLPPFNNNPGGTKASQQTANLLKDEILREAQDFEDLNMFQGVKTLAPLFLVQPSSTSRGRFDFKIPVNVLPGLFVIAGNIEGVSGIDFGDFTL